MSDATGVSIPEDHHRLGGWHECPICTRLYAQDLEHAAENERLRMLVVTHCNSCGAEIQPTDEPGAPACFTNCPDCDHRDVVRFGCALDLLREVRDGTEREEWLAQVDHILGFR